MFRLNNIFGFYEIMSLPLKKYMLSNYVSHARIKPLPNSCQHIVIDGKRRLHRWPQRWRVPLSVLTLYTPAHGAEIQLIFSVFKTLTDQQVTVELKNDLSITGVLKSVDQCVGSWLTTFAFVYDISQVLEHSSWQHQGVRWISTSAHGGLKFLR